MSKNSFVDSKKLISRLIEQLAAKSVIETFTRRNPNRIRIAGERILVATERSGEEFNKIPHKAFVDVYEALMEKGSLTQEEIKLIYRRSAFIMPALCLLSEIGYDPATNSLIWKGAG